MKHRKPFFILALLGCTILTGLAAEAAPPVVTAMADYAPESLYPPMARRIHSPGNKTYFIDPVKGSDRNAGTSAARPWRTCRPVNARLFAPGDRIEIAPGSFQETLMPMGSGTAAKPVEIHFAPGSFDFYPSNAIKLKLHISNSNDDPYTPKAVAMLFQSVRHLRVSGDNTDIYVHGKMIETLFDRAEDVTLSGLAFDYRRPLVSEFTVADVAAGYADVEVNPDSAYAIEDGRLVWIGEGWRSQGTALNQEYDPATGSVWRRGAGPLTGVTNAVEQSPFKLRLFFKENPGLTKGRVIQFRETFRDCAGGFVNRSKNITWKNGAYHSLGGMGIVSQFSENLTFDHMTFAPRPGSGRTTASWADILHFSGCRGKILVADCEMSGTHDDPINVHGTHLRIVGRPASNRILLRFMHPQTYGIEAFVPGDEIEFVSHLSLCAYATNRVAAVAPQNDKDVLLTLENDAPEIRSDNDVIENVSWTPSVEVRNCRISVDSCRGFLLTTRRPILIESNTFLRTAMNAILIADDANNWYESGVVRDATIRGNRFIKCAEPVICITPENQTQKPEKPVHANIRILDNYFDLLGGNAILAKSVRGLTIASNRFSSQSLPVQHSACSEVVIENNTLGAPSSDDAAKEKVPDSPLLTVERIFGKEEYKTQEWGPARWLKDGSGYTTLEKSESVKDAMDVVRHDPQSGQREVLVFATNLIARGQTNPMKIEDHAWSDDTSKLLIFTSSKRVWRRNTRGDYWVFDLKGRTLKKLGGKAAPSTLMFAAFSPDSSRVAYVCRNNLFVQSLKDLRVTRLTSDGSDTIINGTSDWVYEEEFDLRNGFKWSPDGKRIAYWQFDTSGVREFALIDNTSALYPKVASYAYPKAGETNSACRVGVVKASGGRTRWFHPGADPRNHYIPEMAWAKDSSHVVFQRLNRLQNTNEVTRGDAQTGSTQVLLTERDDAWVDAADGWHWIGNGGSFLWPSERDGWRHIYAVSGASPMATLLTPGAYDVIGVAGVDEKQGLLYFIASPDNPAQRYLYRARLDGQGEVQRVSPIDRPGTHSYELSKDCRWAIHTHSSFGQPPVIDLIQLPEHKTVRVLADNARLRSKLAALKPCLTEFFPVDIGNGVKLDAWGIKPPDFDPAKTYPLLLHVYGEPAGSTVLDAWGGANYLWHCMLAQQGYIVMSVDNRGTAAPRGRDWRKCIYRQVGILASADQAAAARQILRERSYLDAKRVGIWGWSGGGSMSLNAIFRYPDLYRAAMAIAFVGNQLYYDTIYQERYMGLPQDNADGFKNGSPITFASQLKGSLLLVHGTGDDNCHYQNCEALINELIKQNKQFSLMSYPNRTHSISEGENTKRHLFETLTRYLKENLPAGQ